MKKKILAFLLVMTMIFALGAAAGAEGSERTGDIVILFTSDVHCGVDQGFGCAGLQAVREYLVAKGNDVILVDDGDNIQGEPLGTMSRGELSIQLMNEMGYAIAIPGNHEFDYGMDRFMSLVEEADFPYISCNFNKGGELVFEPYIIKELGGTKVGFVGVTTPQTLTTSTPKYFQDDSGEFIYGFMEDATGEALFEAVQKAVDDARAEGAEYIVVMGHIGNSLATAPYTYDAIISHTSGIDIFLDGHSHDVEQVTMKDRDGHEVIRSACGTKMANIGWARISADGKLSAGLYTWSNSDSVPSMLGVVNGMSKAVDGAMAKLNDELKTVIAKTAVDLTIYDPEAVDANGAPIRMVRRAETNLGDLCADAFRDQGGADIGIVNGGGVRVSVPAGDITLEQVLKVHPFGNSLSVIEVSGQQILDALEWGVRAIPGESGGFLQVSGLSFEIHTYLESPCTKDEAGMYTGIEGERRVRNVLVGGEPLDPEAFYTVASTDYVLLDSGDGYAMFAGAKVLQERVKLDNQVLIDYITKTLGGTVGEEYETLTGQGRIVIVEEQP